MTMKIFHKPVILLIILVIYGCAQYETAVEKLEWLEPDTFTCDVVQVKSGDRFLCKFPDLEIETISLAGISIPANKRELAIRFSKSVLKRGTIVNIEPAETNAGRADISAYVFIPGGKMLNTLLLEKGYAEVLRDEVNVKYKAVFLKIEDENRSEETEVIEEVETEKEPLLK